MRARLDAQHHQRGDEGVGRMDKFLTYTAEQRERAIRETAARMQLHPTPVEKDFWVCWLLRELFNSQLRERPTHL